MKFSVRINHDIKRRVPLNKNLRRWLNQRSVLGYAVNRFQWHWYPRLFIERPYPIHVDIELSSRCNLHCPMCFREHRTIAVQNNMSFDLFKKIIDEIEGKVYSVKFTGRGENQMNKKFSDYIRYMKEKKFGEVSLITNGQLMDDDKMAAIIDAGLDFVSFSIDGLKEEYERIRAPGKYEDIVALVTRLHQMRAETGATKPMIRIQSIMLPEDRQEEFLRIWGPISDDILFLHFKDYSADAVNVQKQDYPCPMPVQRMMIHHDGTVPMCINDEYEEAVMGDLNRFTVQEVWLGQQFRMARAIHKAGKRTEHYKNCAKCVLTREGHGNNF